MRLTDEILKTSDRCHFESLSQAFALAANGRFGLLPSDRGFNISVSINKNIVDIEALNCLAITKSGRIIDVCYDTTYTGNMDSRVIIPSLDEKSYILAIKAIDQWAETSEGLCEPVYQFIILQESSPLDADMLPIARIVNDFGWRLDELDFVPPCLYLSSHDAFIAQVEKFRHILKVSNQGLIESLDSDCKVAIRIFWPIVEQLRISMDKDIELMTPMMLFGLIQKYISGFLCSCAMDESLNLVEADTFRNYINAPYNYQNVYLRIKEGVALSVGICEKIDKFKDFVCAEVKIEAPTISNENLFKRCTNSKVRIPIENNCPGSTIYYTTDGSEPTNTSNSGNMIVIASGFVGGRDREEDDKFITVKVKSVLNGASSTTNTFKVRLQKDVKHWIEI